MKKASVLLSFLIVFCSAVLVGAEAGGGSGTGMESAPVADSSPLVLSRSDAVLPGAVSAAIAESRQKIKLALFLGIIFNAINTMNGENQSRLRNGFVSMLCYAMKEFIGSDATVSSANRSLYQGFIDEVGLIAKQSSAAYLTIPIVEALISSFKELGKVSGDLCRRLAVSVKEPLCLSEEFEDDFLVFMEKTRELFEAQASLPKAPLIGLQFYLYKAVVDKFTPAAGEDREVDKNKIRWLGAVHHYMRFVLGHKYVVTGLEDHSSKAFLWVDYAPVRGRNDFFSSVEFLECIKTFTSSIHYDGEGSQLSSDYRWSCSLALVHEVVIQHGAYEQLKELADKQYGIICTKPIAFMIELLKAFKSFQKRLDPDYLQASL